MRPVYLDCNATTPIEPAVADLVMRYMLEDYGNSGSRTHEYGANAKRAVERARDQVASVVGAKRDEVIFTSGATESNNIALFGLADHGEQGCRRHIVSSQVEHKAVLEPLEALKSWGFEVDLVGVDEGGRIDVNEIASALRPETLCITIQQVNNETGVRQPIGELCRLLWDHEAYLHVDAAQGFGKDIDTLTSHRIDMISVSGHKIYGPQGVGALIGRRRGYARVPLSPIQSGGGQERGLRPGTLAVPLIAGLGLAAELAEKNHGSRKRSCLAIKEELLRAIKGLKPKLCGDPRHVMENAINLRFPGIDSEALMVRLKDFAAISNGSACTSHQYSVSHVLTAMGLSNDEAQEAVRISWCHLTPEIDWTRMVKLVEDLRPTGEIWSA